MDEEHETYELWAVLAFLRRRWQIVLGTAVLVGLVALVVSSLQSNRYEATSTVLFRDPGLDQRIFDAPILFGGQGLLGGANVIGSETAIGLVELGDVADATAERYGHGLDGEGVDDRILVRGGGSNELVSITATTSNPEESAQLANAYAESFVEIRDEADHAVYRRAFEAVDEKLRSLGPELADTTEAARLRRQLDDLRAIELMQTGDVELVQAAEVPAEAISPKPLRTAVLAGAAGLLLGLIVALLFDRLDRRLRTRREFELAYGTRIVGTVPDLDEGGDPAEDFRSLWTRLRYPAGGPSGEVDLPRTLLVLAARPGEGASTVATGLARAALASGLEVSLVEADLRSPGLAAAFGVAPAPGLAELLRGDASERDAIREAAASDPGATEPSSRSIHLLPAGGAGTDASILTDPALPRLLGDLAAESDLVVVDAPPTGEVADAIPLLGICDAVLLVAATEQPAAVAEPLARELSGRDVKVAGLVLNRASGRLRPR